MATRTRTRSARTASASKPVVRVKTASKPIVKVPAKASKPVAKPAPFESEIRVTEADYKDEVGIDVRTWRLIKGEWIPGKGIRFAREDAAGIIAGIEALMGEEEAAEAA